MQLNHMLFDLILIFTPAFGQYAINSDLRPDITFGDHNDRYDVSSIMKYQNKYFRASDPVDYRRRHSFIKKDRALRSADSFLDSRWKLPLVSQKDRAKFFKKIQKRRQREINSLANLILLRMKSERRAGDADRFTVHNDMDIDENVYDFIDNLGRFRASSIELEDLKDRENSFGYRRVDTERENNLGYRRVGTERNNNFGYRRVGTERDNNLSYRKLGNDRENNVGYRRVDTKLDNNFGYRRVGTERNNDLDYRRVGTERDNKLGYRKVGHDRQNNLDYRRTGTERENNLHYRRVGTERENNLGYRRVATDQEMFNYAYPIDLKVEGYLVVPVN